MEGLERFLAYDLDVIPYIIVSLIIAFSVHEFAHAYMAYKFGDPTAKNQGRLTLNPSVHLDPIGTIFLFIAGFGWARPVPVNRFYFKNPRKAGILVSLAGPVSNLLLAIIGVLIIYIIVRTGLVWSIPTFIFHFFEYFVYLNIILFVFNLLPFPPLDGYRIIEDLAPNDIRAKMTQYEQYGILIFLILVITPLDQYTIHPIFNKVVPGVYDFIYSLLQFLP